MELYRLMYQMKYVQHPSVQCAVCRVQCAVCSVQCAVCSVQCAVCSVQWRVGHVSVPPADTVSRPRHRLTPGQGTLGDTGAAYRHGGAF
jgi:hypothetical protein